MDLLVLTPKHVLTWCLGIWFSMDFVVLVLRLDSTILKVFPDLNDSMIL